MIRPYLLLFTYLILACCATAYPQSGTPPNILFIIGDDISRKSFSIYGGDGIQTPNLDRIGEEGIVFNNMFVTNPKCAPARSCLLTGRYSWQLEEACNHAPYMPDRWVFYPDLLEKAGYEIGFTGKGWAPGHHDREHNPAGWPYNTEKLKPPYKKINGTDYSGNFRVFLEQKKEAKPFCFWLGTREAHRGYELDAWKSAQLDPSEMYVPGFLPDTETIRGDLADYAVEVQWFDKVVGECRAILEEKGLLENTVIMVTADHGKPFPRIKGQVYEEGTHVGFLLRWGQGTPGGRVVEDYVNFPDVAPTLMHLAGLEPGAQMTGKSFHDVIISDRSGWIDRERDFSITGKERHDIGRSDGELQDVAYPVRAIRTEEFLYMRNFKPKRWPSCDPERNFRNTDGGPTKAYLLEKHNAETDIYFSLIFGKRPEEELYDIRKDPDCIRNLAEDPAFAKIKKRLWKKLRKELTGQGDPRILGKGDVFDLYPFAPQKDRNSK
jgi:arylsulfatase A-like enzyme